MKILSGISVIIVAVAAVFYFTSGIVNTADKFFAHINNNNYEDAYNILSEEFRSNTSLNDLKEYISKNSITNYKKINWTGKSINQDRGALTGSITTQSGTVVPIILNFIKAEMRWKIYSLQITSLEPQEETVKIRPPNESEQIELISSSMNAFAVSVNEQSMQNFYKNISVTWQKQFPVKKFDEVYGSLFSAGADLTVLNNYIPQINSEVIIDKDGALLLTGRYLTKPSGVLFSQKYIYEGLSWKLLGFSIDFN